jgi:hypothetical protein
VVLFLDSAVCSKIQDCPMLHSLLNNCNLVLTIIIFVLFRTSFNRFRANQRISCRQCQRLGRLVLLQRNETIRGLSKCQSYIHKNIVRQLSILKSIPRTDLIFLTFSLVFQSCSNMDQSVLKFTLSTIADSIVNSSISTLFARKFLVSSPCAL